MDVQLVGEVLAALEQALTNWESRGMDAALSLSFGLVKSLATQRVDAGVYTGLSKAFQAGLGYFNAASGAEKLELLSSVSVAGTTEALLKDLPPPSPPRSYRRRRRWRGAGASRRRTRR